VRDDERRVLTEIEDHLRMADPAFVARMNGGTCRFPTVTVLVALWFVACPLVSLLFGPTATAALTAAVLAVVVAVVARRRTQSLRPADGGGRRG
jgi:membrane protein implicated in regulation of membrane protease activity